MLNITIVDGNTRTGATAPDGSVYVVETDGNTLTGATHRCGAWYVVKSAGSSFLPLRNPCGALNVVESSTIWNSGQQVHVNAGSWSGGGGGGAAGTPMGLLLALTYSS